MSILKTLYENYLRPVLVVVMVLLFWPLVYDGRQSDPPKTVVIVAEPLPPTVPEGAVPAACPCGEECPCEVCDCSEAECLTDCQPAAPEAAEELTTEPQEGPPTASETVTDCQTVSYHQAAPAGQWRLQPVYGRFGRVVGQRWVWVASRQGYYYQAPCRTQ